VKKARKKTGRHIVFVFKATLAMGNGGLLFSRSERTEVLGLVCRDSGGFLEKSQLPADEVRLLEDGLSPCFDGTGSGSRYSFKRPVGTKMRWRPPSVEPWRNPLTAVEVAAVTNCWIFVLWICSM